MNVKFWHCHDRGTAIEGLLKALAGSGVLRCDKIAAGGVKERVEVDHVAGHVVRPLQNLGADINKKGVARPASENHDPFFGMVHEEEAHGGAGAE